MQEIQYSNKIYKKPKGEVRHTNPKQNGYSLAGTLKWATEVYKEVQVGYSSHYLCIISSIIIRLSCTNLIVTSYLWLCSQIRHLTA